MDRVDAGTGLPAVRLDTVRPAVLHLRHAHRHRADLSALGEAAGWGRLGAVVLGDARHLSRLAADSRDDLQALPDHWLLFFSLLAVHFFTVFVDQEAGRAVRPRDLLLGGAALGLAALSKYNAVVLVPALATVVLLRRPLWPLLRNGWLYAGAGVTLLVLTPVIWWNLENGFLSVRFQLFDRYTGGGLGGLSSQGLVSFLLLSPLLLSPALPALVHFFMQRRWRFGAC